MLYKELKLFSFDFNSFIEINGFLFMSQHRLVCFLNIVQEMYFSAKLLRGAFNTWVEHCVLTNDKRLP